MEAATISSPQRKLNVVPVQKSLSLPSYARAGGEGIDHRVIFAALEQREKVRRKSRIFTREKTARQNIFCLPISSGNKCRETSLSSDTSCSSLEYQKPKPKPKKDEKPPNSDTTANEHLTAKTSQTEAKSNPSHNDVATKIVDRDHESRKNSLKISDYRKGYRSPSDTLRPNVNSSDSMERSSRSSNDSLSRKERLVAIKAKVEAAREKYGDTSSEDENHSSITRYNSDGVIHRTTVREVKSRSYRLEKRLRRRSQDEYALRKTNRKNNLSLCLNSADDGIKLVLERSLNIYEDSPALECKTDFCPSPNFLDFTRKSYFSDFPSKENMSRIVQTRIRQLEEEERKRRNSSDFRDKNKISSRQSPQNAESSSPFSTQRRNAYSSQNAIGSLDSEKNSPSSDILHCPSPIGRAPTPPPRSPKSITFVNKAYIQHQNSYINHDTHSLERKPYFQPNIPVASQTKSSDKINSKCEMTSSDYNPSYNVLEETTDKRKMRELFNSRRKTCGFFDYADNYSFKGLNSSTENATPSKSNVEIILNINQPKTTDSKGHSTETPCGLSDRRLWRSKWGETEKRQEYMFNSLESKKKALAPSWMKNSGISKPNENCLCYVLSGNSSICTCPHGRTSPRLSANPASHTKTDYSSNYANLKNLDVHQSCNRLSKSEINIAYSDQKKSNVQNLKSDLFCDLQPIKPKSSMEKLECQNQTEKLSATANLDSAMEELESVYRSLKFSCDNLSEKNSASNISLNDLNADTSKNYVFNDKTVDLQFKNSSKENNLNLCSNKSNYTKPVDDKKHLDFLKFSVYAPTSEVSGSVSKSPESENLCIDELFNDLTRQLDIEQKLLKESRDSRNGHCTSDLRNRNEYTEPDTQIESASRRLDMLIDGCKQGQTRMTPLESIVSIRKELYDNLQKNSHEHSRPFNAISKDVDKNDNSPLEMAKKRHKAVRSLSENISYLMATSRPSTTALKSSPIEKSETYNCNIDTFVAEKSSPKQYEHIILEPPKIETKKEMSLNQPVVPKRTFISEKHKKPLTEEIRQIRVSMDSNSPELKPVPKTQYIEYPRLTTAVCRPQISPKSEIAPCLPPVTNNSSVSKEAIDVLDENGLEKLLNTLLNEVPESSQSSLLMTKDDAPPTPPPSASAGKCDHVKYKRNILPSKMEAYMAATAKSQVPTSECSQRLKSEEVAQVKNDFRQNSAHLNQMSFIPVYSNKTVCHKFPKSKNDCENHSENATPDRKVLSTYSPPVRPRCTGNSDLLAARIAKTHIRRRSVGFEDMTSLSSYYGHNFTNDRRFQGSVQNSNISPPSAENHSVFQHSDNAQCGGKLNQSDNTFSSWNHNAQIIPSENANDPLQRRLERPLQRYKDKSSKRKSSLNRMDFIQFPNAGLGLQYHSDNSQQRNNSSSDEGSESRFHSKKAESPSGTAKRKISASKINHTTSKPELKTNEVTLRNSSPSKTKSNVLPRSSLTNHSSPRQNRWKQSPTIRFSQKLSHSAGELESLTDFSEVPSRNKTYSSAQEYDDKECSGMASSFRKPGGVVAKSNLCQLSLKHSDKDRKSTSKNPCDITSQVNANNEPTEPNSQSKENVLKDCDNSQSVDQIENISSRTYSEQIVTSGSPNHELKFDCDDSKLPIDEVETSVINLEALEINEDDSKNSDLYLSAEESVDSVGSDGEKRPSSILRKKSSGRKELHSILKPTPDDKFSKTPPSILKHRESSEEKDVWQSNDLHSILKKSTSEDESCNSGTDIRPILKLSTDEDSPSGGVRPRPILKKRTSFSDECSYVSFPSGELKPILKKKTPLSSDEQPRPILKSRRKSEDTRSTISEVITSRPRAYSADMGVKLSHDSQKDSSEVKKDFRNQDSHDL